MIKFIIGLFIGSLITSLITVSKAIKEDEELFAKIEEQEKEYGTFTDVCMQEVYNKHIPKI